MSMVQRAKKMTSKKPRWLHWTATSPIVGYGVLRITTQVTQDRKQHDHYAVMPLKVAEGVAWRLIKLGEFGDREATNYDVRFGPKGDHHCECRGFLRFGYCRHTSAFHKLMEDGILVSKAAELELANVCRDFGPDPLNFDVLT